MAADAAAPSLLQPARQLLSATTLGQYLDIRPPRGVTTLSSGEAVGRALRLMAGTGLVAAPLFADEQRTRYVGFVDLRDIVSAVVAAARQSSEAAAAARGRPAMRLWAAAPAAAHQLAAQPLSSVPRSSNDAQMVYRAQLHHSLLQVSLCEWLSEKPHGYRRDPAEAASAAATVPRRWCRRALSSRWMACLATASPFSAPAPT